MLLPRAPLKKTHVLVPSIEMPSPEHCLHELEIQLNPLDQAHDIDYGISCYCNALQILATIDQ